MEPKLPKIRSVHMTNLYLSVPENLEKFLSEFRQILKDNFQVITVEGENDTRAARSIREKILTGNPLSTLSRIVWNRNWMILRSGIF